MLSDRIDNDAYDGETKEEGQQDYTRTKMPNIRFGDEDTFPSIN